MDRLFLAGLVREIDFAVAGARVRAVRVDSNGRSLTLSLNKSGNKSGKKSGASSELELHLGPGSAGVFTREIARKTSRARPREAKLEKLLASSVIASVDMSELDRVVTVVLEQTRLSGKKRHLALVLELVAVRESVYVIDVDSSNVVDCLSAGTARLATGDRYRALDPPPHASLPAANADELEQRIAEAAEEPDKADKPDKPDKEDELDNNTLLSATGWTPLLVKEMQFLIKENGESPASAFDDLQNRLQASRPVLYVDPERTSTVVLSPITLASETELEPRPMASFNAVMAEAVRLTGDVERSQALRQRLGSAVSRRQKSLRTLRQKLVRQQGQLPQPFELRQKGETLLAGLRQAERIDDAHVRLPDPFHPEGRLIEMEIDPRLGLPENAERMFRRSRKVERTEVALRRRLEEVELQVAYADGMRVSLDDAGGPDELDELESIRREMEEQNLLARSKARVRSHDGAKRLPPRSLTTHRGNVVLVGRSARSNAELTFRLAKPDDLWLHASGMPGSHVVLKRSGSIELDEEEILEAAGYAAYFSKGRNDTYVDVMVAARRNVSKIKGAPPGLVRVSNVKTVRVRPTPPPLVPSGRTGEVR